MSTDIRRRKFIGALFAITQTLDTTKYLPRQECLNKLCCIHRTEYSTATKVRERGLYGLSWKIEKEGNDLIYEKYM